MIKIEFTNYKFQTENAKDVAQLSPILKNIIYLKYIKKSFFEKWV